MGKALFGEVIAGGHLPSMRMARLAGVLVSQREIVAQHEARERLITAAAGQVTEATVEATVRLAQSQPPYELVDA